MELFDAAPASLHTKEGLTQVLRREPTAPLISLDAYHQMTSGERDDYNQLRLAHLSGGILINTPQSDSIVKAIRRALLMNLGNATGRASVLISGDSTMGKTTACIAAMTWALKRYEKRFPDWEQHGHIPVVFVDVPSSATPKTMMGKFLEFIGIHVSNTVTLEERTRLVVSHLRSANTRLIVVDEVHNLHDIGTTIRQSVDVLKGLQNELNATFVFSGANLDGGRILSGPRGRQIAARSQYEGLAPYPLATTQDRKLWSGLVSAFERNLMLFGHRPGTLVRTAADARRLHALTQGAIGDLSRVLTAAAAELIFTDTPAEQEQLTLDLLEASPVSLATEMRRSAA